MEVELAGFAVEQRVAREAKLRQYRSDLEEARRTFAKYQDKYVDKKNEETLMGAHLEDVKAHEAK